MAESVRSIPYGHIVIFIVLVGLSLFVRLLPIETPGASLPGPNLLLALTFAWVLRRPDYIPAVLVCAVFLLEDFLLMRPPGLWALIVLLGTEFLRSREALMRELSFPVEWAMVSGVLLAMFLANRLILAIVFVPQPPLGLSFIQLLMTLGIYPAMVLVSHFAFRVRKPATGEVDSLGRRL